MLRPEISAKLKAQLDRARKAAEEATHGLTGDLQYLGETAEAALVAATECKLDKMARGLLYFGMHQFALSGRADQLIEDRRIRNTFQDERVKLLTLTEDLIVEALEMNCGCTMNRNPSSGERLTHDLTHHMTGGICDTPGCSMGHRLP